MLDVEQLVTEIHATDPLVVINFAGAGAQALAWLHSVGGSSRTVLEATDHYAAKSLIQFIGFEPEQFSSAEVARAMATQAYLRACELTEPGTPVAGVGATATIATDRTKRGDHRACVALCDANRLTTCSLTMTKGARSRHAEEELVSLLILRAVAQACRQPDRLSLSLLPGEEVLSKTEAAGVLARLISGAFPLVTAWPDGTLTPARQRPNVAILSGAFNPLHAGHRQLAQVAANQLNQPVNFELPLVNAGKPAIAPKEAMRRIRQFRDIGPLFLTAAPLFHQKARLFPQSVFIIGVDTAARLIQPRFYQDSYDNMLASLAAIRRTGCSFLVAGRLQDDEFLTLSALALPPGYRELFKELPEQNFRVDISSTELRQGE